MGRILLYAPEDNLKLESVVVTAKEAPNAMATSRTIGGNAIDHLQMVNASDISSLLPGGKTINPDLTKDNVFSLRSGGSAAGNASFGTAVEVDGVRISTNASLGEMSGASTRNIASTNIESVEVVTGRAFGRVRRYFVGRGEDFDPQGQDALYAGAFDQSPHQTNLRLEGFRSGYGPRRAEQQRGVHAGP